MTAEAKQTLTRSPPRQPALIIPIESLTEK